MYLSDLYSESLQESQGKQCSILIRHQQCICWKVIYIYVEIERARLRKIKEDQGLIAEAADLMQEQVAVSIFFSKFPQKVETFGAMAKTEKIAFIIVLLIRVGESTIEGRKGVPRPMELRIS
ncbi:hypothetical protein DY000_02005804 [Brassica cretica]|uniref:PSMD12/CSN4-like N-terminal domain-containing protein n=1 Tax=Brassica cretica TaxID=69181 RepID=A0ABQ7CGY5_BRACR|nr:hypothetical protein DY000_02005804 [Brassica cretica]